MWAIRILSGPDPDSIFRLKPGINILGRAVQSDVFIQHQGVSKQHLELKVIEGGVLLRDLGSRNGTFLNGVKIQSALAKIGDKISIENLVLEIGDGAIFERLQQNRSEVFSDLREPQHSAQSSAPISSLQRPGLIESVQQYIEGVVISSLCRLAEKFEFSSVIGTLVALFVLLVTVLSTVPMNLLLKSGIEKESRRRALTIARNLARTNEQNILQGAESLLSTQTASLEEGVLKAMLVSQLDGSIIAPPEKAGEYANDPFVTTARREVSEFVRPLDSGKIGATVPIKNFNAELGAYQVVAHAIVIYDMDSLAVDKERILGLFVRILFIAVLLGAILFYLSIRIIARPIEDLNDQLDHSLKNGGDHVKVHYKYRQLRDLAANISSALVRLSQHSQMSQMSAAGSSQPPPLLDLERLVRMVSYPAVAVSSVDYSVAALNLPFQDFVGGLKSEWLGRDISSLIDSEFSQQLLPLLDTVKADSSQQISSPYWSGDAALQIQVTSFTLSESVKYLVIVVQPSEDASGIRRAMGSGG